MTFKGKHNPSQMEKGPEEGYDMYASSYVRDEQMLNKFDLKMLMRDLRLLKGQRVLDLGCGTGRLAPLLRKREADDVVGLDISGEMLKLAQGTGAYRELVKADILQELPFAWDSFDLILCSMVLVHVPQKQVASVLGELYRVLVPGGMLYLVNLPQRRAPRLRLPDGETIVISSYVHADARVMDALEDAGFDEILIDRNEQDQEHFATLIRATKPL